MPLWSPASAHYDGQRTWDKITWDMFLTQRPNATVLPTFVLPKGTECPSLAGHQARCREYGEGITAYKEHSLGGRQNRMTGMSADTTRALLEPRAKHFHMVFLPKI